MAYGEIPNFDVLFFATHNQVRKDDQERFNPLIMLKRGLNHPSLQQAARSFKPG